VCVSALSCLFQLKCTVDDLFIRKFQLLCKSHVWHYCVQMVKAGLILGLFGSNQKFANNKVSRLNHVDMSCAFQLILISIFANML
jgi:hypothetical protein